MEGVQDGIISLMLPAVHIPISPSGNGLRETGKPVAAQPGCGRTRLQRQVGSLQPSTLQLHPARGLARGGHSLNPGCVGHCAGARIEGAAGRRGLRGAWTRPSSGCPRVSSSLSKWYKEYFHKHSASSAKTGNHQTPAMQGGRRCCNARGQFSPARWEFITPVTPDDSDILKWIHEGARNSGVAALRGGGGASISLS